MSSDEEEEPKEKQIGDYLLNEELGSGSNKNNEQRANIIRRIK